MDAATYDTAELERYRIRSDPPIVFFTPDEPVYDHGPAGTRDIWLCYGRYVRPGAARQYINLGLGDEHQTNRSTYVCSGGGWASHRSCGYVCPPGEALADHPSECPNCGNPMGRGWAPLVVPADAFLACWCD